MANNEMLRHCSFNPAEHMIEISEGKLYLPVNERINWFNTFRKETAISGVINEGDYQLVDTPVGPVWIVDAVVILGDESYRGRFMKPVLNCAGSMDETAFSTAYTKAIGRALAHAGFGTDEIDAADGRDGSTLCDAPITAVNQKVPTLPVDPAAATARSEESNSEIMPAAAPAEKTRTVGMSVSAESIPETESAPIQESSRITEEDARQVVVTKHVKCSKGDLGNKTMGEILELAPEFIRYVADHPQKFATMPEVVKAATVLRAAAGEAVA